MSGKFLDAEKIAATLVGFNTIFNEALANMASQAALFANVIATTKTSEQFNWLGAVPAFQKWIGERKITKLRAANYTIGIDKYATGLEVDQDDLDDDQLGIFLPKIRDLAGKVVEHVDLMIMDYIANGFATTKYGAGYDGVAFFSASHKNGDGPTQTNLGTATLDDTGAFDTAMQKMAELVDENGTPLSITPTHLVVGPKLWRTALDLLKAQFGANGASNVHFGAVEPVKSPRLVGSYADYWFLMDLGKSLKPMIHLVRRPVQFRSVVGADSIEKFLRDKLYFGADARYGFGYGLWELVYGSNGTT